MKEFGGQRSRWAIGFYGGVQVFSALSAFAQAPAREFPTTSNGVQWTLASYFDYLPAPNGPDYPTIERNQLERSTIRRPANTPFVFREGEARPVSATFTFTNTSDASRDCRVRMTGNIHTPALSDSRIDAGLYVNSFATFTTFRLAPRATISLNLLPIYNVGSPLHPDHPSQQSARASIVPLTDSSRRIRGRNARPAPSPTVRGLISPSEYLRSYLESATLSIFTCNPVLGEDPRGPVVAPVNEAAH